MDRFNIGLFGGTFNPPHNGHISIAKDFYGAADLDLLIVMPSFIPPHKASFPIGPSHRLAMTKLAFSEFDGMGIRYMVSDYEIQKGGTSYTVETVEHLLEEYGVKTLALCIGSDMFLSFETWKSAEKLMQMCHLYTKERFPGEKASLDAFAGTLQKRYGAKVTVLKQAAFEVSSTELRTRETFLSKEYLCPKVLDYIKEHALYENG